MQTKTHPTLRLAVLALIACASLAAAEAPPRDLSRLDPAQRAWLKATPEQRRGLGEAIGEQGGRDTARRMGHTVVFDGRDKGIAQGPDQVYVGRDGRVHVFECKANDAPLNHAYGHRQGTVEHAVESARRVLRSSKASPAQREAARRVLEAAENSTLDVHVVRTRHVLGKPTPGATTVESTISARPRAARPAAARPQTAPKALPKASPPANAWSKPLKQATRLIRYVF